MSSRTFVYALLLFAAAVPLGRLQAQDSEKAAPKADQREQLIAQATKQIEDAIKTYVNAFNAGDVSALSKLWTKDCVYSIQGELTVGRDAIIAGFKKAIDESETKMKLAVNTSSIEMISPSVALERGVAVVTRGEAVDETEYTAVYVKEGGRWLIDRVTEEEVQVRASNYEFLAELEWLVGDWEDSGEGFTIAMSCDWTANKNFISRKFAVASDDGEFASSGLQIIGWDAKAKRIRSWLFDSNGGFVSGVWTKRDNRWVVQSTANLPDGTSGSFTSIFTPQSDGNYAWEKVNRVMEGKLLPNIDQVVVRRK